MGHENPGGTIAGIRITMKDEKNTTYTTSKLSKVLVGKMYDNKQSIYIDNINLISKWKVIVQSINAYL